MKLTLILHFIITVACITLHPVSADMAVRLLLNKGNPLPVGAKCNNSELNSITNTINNVLDLLNLRRNLRQVQRYPAWCREKCRGWATGTCRGTNPECNGYRRELGEKKGLIQSLLQSKLVPKTLNTVTSIIAPTPTCTEDFTNEINSSLNDIKSSLSSSCQKALDMERDFLCLASIDNCNVQKIQVINTDNDTILSDNMKNGMSFCKSGPNINFKAVNDACVCNVEFDLKKTNAAKVIRNQFAYHEPYVLFSKSESTGYGNIDTLGQKLDVGNYTLQYFPDGDKSKLKTISFVVNDC